MNYMDFVVNDAINEDNIDELFKVIFADDLKIDFKKMSEFLNSRYDVYCKQFSKDVQSEMKIFLEDIYTDPQKFDDLILNIKCLLVSENSFSEDIINMIDSKIFWFMFAISVKKCVGQPLSKIDNTEEYFSYMNVETEEQKNAHIQCINAYSNDCNNFSLKRNPELCLFLHKFGSKNKKIKTKKKNVSRVVRRTKKLMQIYKISHRHNSYNIFKGQCHIVPEDFAKMIVTFFCNVL